MRHSFGHFMPRFAAVMMLLSSVFFVTSWPFRMPIRISDDFPNCVSARWDNQYFAIGSMSQHQMSSLFITRVDLTPGTAIWSELRDGHFCSFRIPPTPFSGEPAGFNLHIGMDTVGWDCPYLLMVVFWSAIYFKTSSAIQFSIRDLLGVVAIAAVVVFAIQSRISLLITVFLNLSTIITAVVLIILAMRSIIQQQRYPASTPPTS
jgi:hypothetical protein